MGGIWPIESAAVSVGVARIRPGLAYSIAFVPSIRDSSLHLQVKSHMLSFLTVLPNPSESDSHSKFIVRPRLPQSFYLYRKEKSSSNGHPLS